MVGIKRSVEPVRLAKRNLTADCTDETIPECVQFLYDIPLTPATNANNRLGVTGRFGNSAHFSFLQVGPSTSHAAASNQLTRAYDHSNSWRCSGRT